MKKMVILISLLMPLCALADDFGATIPEWKDFVPATFVNVKEPKGLGKLNVTAMYWYERRVEFETEMEKCVSYPNNDERFNCYENLKQVQYNKNSDYNARLEAKQQASAIQEMNSMQDTMLPINHYLQSFGRFQPNEFK